MTMDKDRQTRQSDVVGEGVPPSSGTEAGAKADSIALSLLDGVWHASYHGPHAAGVVELFGTNCIPTAYTRKTSLDVVVRELAKRNPNVEVS